jgi:hypothetical protein
MTTIGVRELYGMSRWGMFLFYLFQVFSLSMLVLNFAMLVWNLSSRSYGKATVSGTVTIMLAIVLVHQQRQTARHRREYAKYLAIARKHLNRAFALGMCPDCGELSLDGNLICHRIECRSRFRCDPVTQEWTRLSP